MKLFVVAPSGMLGRAWMELLRERGLPHCAGGRPGLDILDGASVDAGIPSDVDVIVNCSAWTDVDGAETHEADATAVNGLAVRTLAERAKAIGAVLVHYGTDYVFDGQGSVDGEARAPYRVDAPVAPINAYGRSKAAGEAALKESGCEHLYLRTSWLYAPWGKNFVLTMAKLAKERDTLRVVDDQRGRPTSAEHLARTTLALLEKGARGFLHVTDGGECSWHELASHVASRVSPRCTVQPCSSDEYPRPAKRPAYSVLDVGPTEAIVGTLEDWRVHVDRVLHRAGLV